MLGKNFGHRVIRKRHIQNIMVSADSNFHFNQKNTDPRPLNMINIIQLLSGNSKRISGNQIKTGFSVKNGTNKHKFI